MFPSLRTLFRCVVITLIVALPPTAGCRNFWKADVRVTAQSTQLRLARG
jgi:hypothetical protein